MKSISRAELEEIFEDTDFGLDFSTALDKGYCCIYQDNKVLCHIIGKACKNQVYDEWLEEAFDNRESVTNDCRYAFSCLEDTKREKLFDVLGLKPLSDVEKKEFEQRRQKAKRREFFIFPKPKYSKTFPSNSNVFMVKQREELILENTNFPQFIGTANLAPCIGLAVIAKKEDNVLRVGVAHVDASTQLDNCLKDFLDRLIKDADHADVIMISSQASSSSATLKKGKQILRTIEAHPELKNKISVYSDLKAHPDSASLAVNVQTGDVYKNVPIDCFVVTCESSRLDGLQLFKPSALLPSGFYDPEKRKNPLPFVKKTIKNENSHEIANDFSVEDNGLTLEEVFHALENKGTLGTSQPTEGLPADVRKLLEKLHQVLPNNTEASDMAKMRKQIETILPSHDTK